jgi:arabinogalactan oligomer / maltooligosaccharide transport system substrate-binding protein
VLQGERVAGKAMHKHATVTGSKTMSHEIFISYSHKDKPIADAICANLESAGFRCWIAPRDIAPGQDWPTAISTAISKSRLMVLVFSANSNSSPDVGRELILAANNNLIIIPFKIDNILPEPGKEYYLARTHWLDAMNPPTQAQIDKLVSYVRSFLREVEASTDGEKQHPATLAAAPTQRTKPELTDQKRKSRWKTTWLLGMLLLFAIGAGSLFLFDPFGLAKKPVPPTATPTLLAPGVTPSLEIPTETTGPVTITIWHQWGNDIFPAIQDAFNDYTAEHPNVTIVPWYSGTNAVNAFNAAMPAGQGPDIVIGGQEYISKNTATSNLVPLDDLGISQDWLKSSFEPAPAGTVIWNGKIWGLPADQTGIALIYNKSLAKSTDFPNNSSDLNNLISMSYDFKNREGIPLFCFGDINGYFLAPIFLGFGVPTYVDAQGNAYLNTPQALAAMTWLNDAKPVTLQDVDNYQGTSAMVEGKAAAVWNGPWIIPELEKAKINYGVLAMGGSFISGDMLMLTSNAVDRGHEAIALDIMKYFTSTEVQVRIALAVAPNAIYITSQTAALNNGRVQAIAKIAEFGAALRQGTPIMNNQYAQIAFTLVDTAVDAIWQGSQTPEEALATAQAAIEAEVASAK